MKEEIAQYQPLQPSVVAVGTNRVRAFVGDEKPTLHGALWVGDQLARVVTLAGDRRVEAVLFDTAGVEVGTPVRCEDTTAHWPLPIAGATEVEALRFTTASPATPPPTQPTQRALHTGVELLDELLPLLQTGVTLLLDASEDDALVDRVAAQWAQPFVGAATRPLPHASHQVLGGSALALVVAASWASQLGRPLHVEAAPFDLDTLFDAPHGAVLARMQLRDGLEAIAETLEVGRSDTQIVLDRDGRVDLTRSSSRHTTNQALWAQLTALDDAQQRQRLLGEEELDEAQREVLALAARLREQLR